MNDTSTIRIDRAEPLVAESIEEGVDEGRLVSAFAVCAVGEPTRGFAHRREAIILPQHAESFDGSGGGFAFGLLLLLLLLGFRAFAGAGGVAGVGEDGGGGFCIAGSGARVCDDATRDDVGGDAHGGHEVEEDGERGLGVVCATAKMERAEGEVEHAGSAASRGGGGASGVGSGATAALAPGGWGRVRVAEHLLEAAGARDDRSEARGIGRIGVVPRRQRSVDTVGGVVVVRVEVVVAGRFRREMPTEHLRVRRGAVLRRPRARRASERATRAVRARSRPSKRKPRRPGGAQRRAHRVRLLERSCCEPDMTLTPSRANETLDARELCRERDSFYC